MLKIASTNQLKISDESDESEEEAEKKVFKDDGTDNDDDLFKKELPSYELKEKEKKDVEKITGGLQGYLDQVKLPYLENKGDDPVVSYNDILGPFTINWDDTNREQKYSKLGGTKKVGDQTVDIHSISKLTKITIKYLGGGKEVLELDDNDNYNSSGIKIMQEKVVDGKKSVEVFKKPWKIDKNTPFYIINPNLEKEVVGISIHLKKKAKFRSATYQVYNGVSAYPDTDMLKEKIETKVQNDNKDSGWDVTEVNVNLTSMYEPQKNMEVFGFTLTAVSELDLDIGVIAKKGDIELTKKGIYTTKEAQKDENGNFLNTENGGKIYDEVDHEESLPNVTFKVYCDNVQKYIKDVVPFGDGTKIEFTGRMEEAKEYVTDENGVVLIQDLFAGRGEKDGEKDGYTYKLIEVYKEDNENYYYIDPIKIESTTSKYSQTTTKKAGKSSGDDSSQEDTGIATGHWKVGDKKYCTIENITVYYDDGYTGKDKNGNKSQGQCIKTYILIKDDRTSGNLLIEKNDETFPKNVKLKDVEFKVKLVKSASKDAEGNEDTEHNLNCSGWLKSLSLCEKNSPNRVDSNNPMNESSTRSSKTADKNTINSNIESQNDVMKISRIIAKNNATGADVSTRESSGNSGNSLDDQDDDRANVYDYSEFLHDEYLTDDPDEAQIFTTSEEGLIKIKCIVNGDYEIYEVKSAEGYDITRQWYYGKDEEHLEWVDYGKEEESYSDWGEGEECYPSRDDHGLVTISTGDNYYKPVYSNRKIVAKISGNIWEDVQRGNKTSGEYDSLYYMGNPDTVLSENDVIKVKLYIRKTEKINGDITRIDSLTGDARYDCVAETTVDSSGHWEIGVKDQDGPGYNRDDKSKDIYYWELADGYIEYIYNNQQYVCTDIFAKVQGSIQESVERNSKAKEEMLTEEELDDRKLSGVNDTSQTQRNLPRKCNYNKRCNSCFRKNSTRYNRT